MNGESGSLGRVLVVDDDAPLLGLLCAVLEEAGYNCDGCLSGRQALEAVERESRRQGPLGWSPWDVLVLDVKLQDIEGFELLEMIRGCEGFATAPAFFISGVRLDGEDIARGLALGALDYLAKPFENAIFVAKVNNFAELGRFRRVAHRTALALEESEANYRELFENIADAVFVHDFEGRILDVNEASCSRFGYSRSELLGMKLADLILPECCTVLLDSIQVSPSNQLIPFEAEFRTRDGQTIPCEILQRLIARRDRKVIQSVARDITARKIAEEHLRWRNRELAAYYAIARTVGESLDLDHIFTRSLEETLEVLEAQMGALFLLGEDDHLVAVACCGLGDDFVRTMEGESGQGEHQLREILGSAQVATIDDLSYLPPAVRQAADGEGILSLAILSVQSRGLTLGLLLIAYRQLRHLQDRELEMLRVIGTEIGVALENGRLYSAVMDSERRYRELFEGIGDPVFLHDLSGRIQAVNQAACSLLGFTEDELLLENLEQIGGEAYSQEVHARGTASDTRGRLPLFETTLRTRRGRMIDVEVHARVVVSGGRPCVLSVFRDVTGRKWEERRALAVGSIRGALGRYQSSRDYLHEVLHVVSAFAGCECVGIRVLDAQRNLPFLARVGFTDEFVESEERQNLNGNPCLCARLLRGDFSPIQGEYTGGGSFFCDNLSALFSAADAQTQPFKRTGCLDMPFESVALVPIHRGSERIGLIHVADRRPGRVSPDSVEVLEEVGGIVGMALRQFDLEESLAWETRQTQIGFGLTGSILEGKPLEQAMSRVLEQIAELTGFDVLTVERFHPGQDAMEMWVCRCPGLEGDLGGWIVPCDQTLSGRAAKTGELVEELDFKSIHPALQSMKVEKAMAFPIRHKEQTVGVLTAAGSRSVRARAQVVEFLRAIADQLALVIGWTDAQLELDRSRRELRSLSARLIQAQEEERGRIARELHDSLGQILASINIDIDRRAARLSKHDTALTGFLSKLRAHLNEAHATVRHLTGLLRPGILDDLGLVAALESYLEEFEARTGVVCHFEKGVESLTLDPNIAVALYRVAQEALTNVALHARARHVRVNLSSSGDGRLILKVCDDGCGFDLASLDWQTSFGLLGMRERVQLVGGQVQITTQPGAGAEIQATVPME